MDKSKRLKTVKPHCSSQLISPIDSSAVSQKNDPNILWDLFLKPIDAYLDKHCPYIERIIKDRHESWMHDEIMDVIFERETCLNLYRVDHMPEQKAAILACRRKIDKMSKASKKGGIIVLYCKFIYLY